MTQQEGAIQTKTVNVKGVNANSWARFRQRAVRENRNTGDMLADAIDQYVWLMEREEAKSVAS